MKRLSKLIIGIGGNLNSSDGLHPVEVGKKAILQIQSFSMKVKKVSSWYISEPIPKSDQPDFFNCVVFANTYLNEFDVLEKLHLIEETLGRVRVKINEPRSIDLEMNAQNNEFLVFFSPKAPIDTGVENTEATVSNIRIYFLITDLEEFMLKNYAAYILPDGNTIHFLVQFRKNSSLFVDKVSSVVKGLSAAEMISHGEVGKALRAKPITTTHLRLPEDVIVSPIYFNKASDNNKLEISIFDNNVDGNNPFTKQKLFTQKHIYWSICVSVDRSYIVYEEVTEEHDATKELNKVLGMFSNVCNKVPK